MREEPAHIQIYGVDRGLTIFAGIVYSIPSLAIVAGCLAWLWVMFEEGRQEDWPIVSFVIAVTLAGAWLALSTLRYTYRAVRGYVVLPTETMWFKFAMWFSAAAAPFARKTEVSVSKLTDLALKILAWLLLLAIVAVLVGIVIFGVKWLFSIPSWALVIIVLLILILISVSARR